MIRVVRSMVAVIALATIVTACGDETKVGGDELLNFEDQKGARLGETTTTTAPPVSETTVPRGNVGVGSPTTTTTRPQATTTTTAQVRAFEIVINSDDGAATQFDPRQARVLAGAVVRWVNKDSQARSVVSDDGRTIVSPSIAPGASWEYTASKVGEFNYHDGTRPYAVAKLFVVSR